MKIDGFVKSLKLPSFVIPAKAGIQFFQDVLDPGFRRGDAPRDFLRDHQNCKVQNSNFAATTANFLIFNLTFAICNSFLPILQTAKMLRGSYVSLRREKRHSGFWGPQSR